MYGGAITKNPHLEKIVSIGFEFESGRITPFKIIHNKRLELLPAVDDNGIQLRTPMQDVDMIVNTDTAYVNITTELVLMNEFVISENLHGYPSLLLTPENIYITTRGRDIRDMTWPHTEFHFTYHDLDKRSSNVILEKLHQSFSLLKTFFAQFTVRNKNIIEGHDSNFPKNPNDNIVILRTPRNTELHNQLGFLMPSTWNLENDLSWIVQMTFGIRMIDVPDVITALADMTGYISKGKLSMVNKTYDDIIYILTNLTLIDGELPADIRAFVYIFAMFDADSDNQINLEEIPKTKVYFAVRHSLEELFASLRTTSKKFLIENSFLLEPMYPLWNTLMRITESVIDDTLRYEDVKQFRLYPHVNPEENVIYIEVRSFHRQFKELLGGEKPTINNALEFLGLVTQNVRDIT